MPIDYIDDGHGGRKRVGGPYPWKENENPQPAPRRVSEPCVHEPDMRMVTVDDNGTLQVHCKHCFDYVGKLGVVEWVNEPVTEITPEMDRAFTDNVVRGAKQDQIEARKAL